jgi:hypothetical protein
VKFPYVCVFVLDYFVQLFFRMLFRIQYQPIEKGKWCFIFFHNENNLSFVFYFFSLEYIPNQGEKLDNQAGKQKSNPTQVYSSCNFPQK